VTSRRTVAAAGHIGDDAAARAGLDADDPHVRATALTAVARCGVLTAADVERAVADVDPIVRRRAAEVVAAGPVVVPITRLLRDSDPTVVEVAAWACGEVTPVEAGAVTTLAELATAHDDALVREAAVAALGAIGDPAGLPAVLAATTDKPAIRRRAVIALAAFDGPEVEAAIARAKDDRDWQVRAAAEDLA
jgi:HEAT repeat protein